MYPSVRAKRTGRTSSTVITSILQHTNCSIRQVQLRKCEYDEYLHLSQEAGKRLHASAGKKQPTPGWCPEAEEIQQQVNEKFRDYPEVAQNFRAFVQNGHVAITQSRATGKK